jgi:hypothetical protein
MGTNLLNLFPSFPDKRTCHGARLRLLRLVFRHQRCLRFVSCLCDPKPSITTCYSGNFRFSFRFPCGFLPGGSRLKSAGLSILRFIGFPGYSHCLATCDFLRKLHPTCVMICFHFKLHYLKNAQCLFSCRPSDLFPGLALR